MAFATSVVRHTYRQVSQSTHDMPNVSGKNERGILQPAPLVAPSCAISATEFGQYLRFLPREARCSSQLRWDADAPWHRTSGRYAPNVFLVQEVNGEPAVSRRTGHRVRCPFTRYERRAATPVASRSPVRTRCAAQLLRSEPALHTGVRNPQCFLASVCAWEHDQTALRGEVPL